VFTSSSIAARDRELVHQLEDMSLVSFEKNCPKRDNETEERSVSGFLG
jgi:hypothetical protein